MKINKELKSFFPFLIKNEIEGFNKWNKGSSHTLSVINKSLDDQINILIKKIYKEKALFICRMSDGEYTFLLGHQPPVLRATKMHIYFAKYAKYLYQKIFSTRLRAETKPGTSSGNYALSESADNKDLIAASIKNISNHGYLALHLTYAQKPFQEKFHNSLIKYFKNNNIVIHKENYVPFYCVYALFKDKSFIKYLENKKVTIITGASDKKKTQIEKFLFNRYNLGSINWHPLSQSRSLFDDIDENHDFGEVTFIGAGIGKFNIFNQLIQMNKKTVAIDVGYLIEYWNDPNGRHNRPYV